MSPSNSRTDPVWPSFMPLPTRTSIDLPAIMPSSGWSSWENSPVSHLPRAYWPPSVCCPLSCLHSYIWFFFRFLCSNNEYCTIVFFCTTRIKLFDNEVLSNLFFSLRRGTRRDSWGNIFSSHWLISTFSQVLQNSCPTRLLYFNQILLCTSLVLVSG